MAINFLTQRKLEDFTRSFLKGTPFTARISNRSDGTFIEVIANPGSVESIFTRLFNVSIPKGDKPNDTLLDVTCIIKENGGLLK